MKTKTKEIVLLVVLTIISTLLVWFPFSFLQLGKGMLTLFANYDGPNYLVIAKTLYAKDLIASSFSLPIPLEYYPAHLPGYPLTIKVIDSFLSGPWAMLYSTLFFSVALVIAYYLFLKKFNLSSEPIWLTIIFLFLPARWLIVRSVGSPEPLFLFAIITSFYFFKNGINNKEYNFRDFFLAGIFGALAQITKTPAILLFFAYAIYLVWYALTSASDTKSHDSVFLRTQSFSTKYRDSVTLCFRWVLIRLIPLLIIPLSLLPVFTFYQFQTGDFFAYFHSGDNFHLVFPPFQAFVTGRNWLGDFWLEDMIYVYLTGILGIILLFRQKLFDLGIFATVFFTATLFISHRDLSRYSLPLFPIILIAFSPFLVRKEFKIAFFFILIPIYLYTINFILFNTAPIADWTPYL